MMDRQCKCYIDMHLARDSTTCPKPSQQCVCACQTSALTLGPYRAVYLTVPFTVDRVQISFAWPAQALANVNLIKQWLCAYNHTFSSAGGQTNGVMVKQMRQEMILATNVKAMEHLGRLGGDTMRILFSRRYPQRFCLYCIDSQRTECTQIGGSVAEKNESKPLHVPYTVVAVRFDATKTAGAFTAQLCNPRCVYTTPERPMQCCSVCEAAVTLTAMCSPDINNAEY